MTAHASREKNAQDSDLKKEQPEASLSLPQCVAAFYEL